MLAPGPSDNVGLRGSSTRFTAHLASTSPGKPILLVRVNSNRTSKRLAALVWWHNKKHAKKHATTVVAPVDPSALQAASPSVAAIRPVALQPALVATGAVNVHVGPETSSQTLFTLSQGQGVDETGSRSNWIEVKTASGETGWVYSRFLSKAPAR